MRWRLASLVLLLFASVTASAKTPALVVDDPRAFGYFLGDTIVRRVKLRLGPDQKLESGVLPRPGPVNYWLELGSIKHDEAAEGSDTVHTLELTYQTFYTPLDPRRLEIPGFTLKLQGGGEISVPAFGFITSPIRQLFAASSQSTGSAVDLQADAPAPRLPTGAERTALLIFLLVALGALIGLAWHRAWWPFHARPSRPFTDTARYLRVNASRLDDANGYRTALLKLHRAFDVAAGRRVLAEDVPVFLAEHPQFQPQGPKIERLFHASRRAFFANDVDEARDTMPLSALLKLGADLGVCERRAA